MARPVPSSPTPTDARLDALEKKLAALTRQVDGLGRDVGQLMATWSSSPALFDAWLDQVADRLHFHPQLADIRASSGLTGWWMGLWKYWLFAWGPNAGPFDQVHWFEAAERALAVTAPVTARRLAGPIQSPRPILPPGSSPGLFPGNNP
jgi:hypothetical protein